MLFLLFHVALFYVKFHPILLALIPFLFLLMHKLHLLSQLLYLAKIYLIYIYVIMLLLKLKHYLIFLHHDILHIFLSSLLKLKLYLLLKVHLPLLVGNVFLVLGLFQYIVCIHLKLLHLYNAIHLLPTLVLTSFLHPLHHLFFLHLQLCEFHQ